MVFDMKASSQQKPRVMVVDDEEIILEIYKKMLEHMGIEAEPHAHGKDAVESFINDPFGFDLIITDSNLPDIKGENLAKQLTGIRPDIPIILCSGYHEPTADTLKESGFQAFLMKPVLYRDLEAAVLSNIVFPAHKA